MIIKHHPLIVSLRRDVYADLPIESAIQKFDEICRFYNKIPVKYGNSLGNKYVCIPDGDTLGKVVLEVNLLTRQGEINRISYKRVGGNYAELRKLAETFGINIKFRKVRE